MVLITGGGGNHAGGATAGDSGMGGCYTTGCRFDVWNSRLVEPIFWFWGGGVWNGSPVMGLEEMAQG